MLHIGSTKTNVKGYIMSYLDVGIKVGENSNSKLMIDSNPYSKTQ